MTTSNETNETSQRTPHRIFSREPSVGVAPYNDGETLRALRTLAGVSQGELGDLCGWSPSYVSRLESGGRELTPEMLALAKGALLPSLRRVAQSIGLEIPAGIRASFSEDED